MIDVYSKTMVERFEGCKLIPYKDIAGFWTIGFGRKISETQAKQYSKGITQGMADAWFQNDIMRSELNLLSILSSTLISNKLGSMISLAFNVGVGPQSLNHGSHIIEYINQGLFDKASNEFVLWDHAGGKEVEGLKRRRLIEKTHFDKGPELGENVNTYITRLFASIPV